MKTQKLSFFTLVLLISFASVNAVLFTPALPAIAHFFNVAAAATEQTISVFLIGYALGQLVYGPFANRFGRKPTLYAGISLQVLSSFICAIASPLHSFTLLMIGRFFLALGSGIGLKMTFTLVTETHDTHAASSKLTYLSMAFAITPAIGVMLGSVLTDHFGWQSTFYAGAIYGVILLFLVTRLPETKQQLDYDAFRLEHLIKGYADQFKNLKLVAGGLLMGCSTCFPYVFATLAPFITMNLMHMDINMYGVANLVPPIGLIAGSIISAQLIQYFSSKNVIRVGILIGLVGSVLMLILTHYLQSAFIAIFIPMLISYFGLAMVFANASAVAMSTVVDKAHGSAVMSFLNMGFVTIVILCLATIKISIALLPILLILVSLLMLILQRFVLMD